LAKKSLDRFFAKGISEEKKVINHKVLADIVDDLPGKPKGVSPWPFSFSIANPRKNQESSE